MWPPQCLDAKPHDKTSSNPGGMNVLNHRALHRPSIQ